MNNVQNVLTFLPLFSIIAVIMLTKVTPTFEYCKGMKTKFIYGFTCTANCRSVCGEIFRGKKIKLKKTIKGKLPSCLQLVIA